MLRDASSLRDAVVPGALEGARGVLEAVTPSCWRRGAGGRGGARAGGRYGRARADRGRGRARARAAAGRRRRRRRRLRRRRAAQPALELPETTTRTTRAGRSAGHSALRRVVWGLPAPAAPRPINEQDERGDTALHRALRHMDERDRAHMRQLDALVRADGVNLDKPNDEGERPLHVAIGMRLPRCTRALLDAGCDCYARTRGGFTPLLAAAERFAAAVELLVAHLVARGEPIRMKSQSARPAAARLRTSRRARDGGARAPRRDADACGARPRPTPGASSSPTRGVLHIVPHAQHLRERRRTRPPTACSRHRDGSPRARSRRRRARRRRGGRAASAAHARDAVCA